MIVKGIKIKVKYMWIDTVTRWRFADKETTGC